MFLNYEIEVNLTLSIIDRSTKCSMEYEVTRKKRSFKHRKLLEMLSGRQKMKKENKERTYNRSCV